MKGATCHAQQVVYMDKAYAAPIADMRFLLQTQTSRDISGAMPLLDQAALFSEQQWDLTKGLGDAQGCAFDQGQVTLPELWGGQCQSRPLARSWARCSAANPALSMIPALTMSGIQSQRAERA